jgi:hypothetical protein
MNTTCPICGGTLGEGLLNEEYLQCRSCKTQFKKESALNLTEEAKYFDNVERDLLGDRRHYDGLVADLSRHPRIFNRFSGICLKKGFDEIYCLGGGFPKLESYFKTRSIIVSDLAAEQYGRFTDTFRRIYGYEGGLEYRKYFIYEDTSIYDDLLSKIDPGKRVLISFVHFLEHVTPVVIRNVLRDLKKARRKGLTFMIYQPNAAAAVDRGWHHYGAADHITLIPIDAMRALLSKEGFNILYSRAHSDDMFFLFS